MNHIFSLLPFIFFMFVYFCFVGELVLLCLGPLTNIAAILQMDPDFGKRLKSCYVMGGNYHGEKDTLVSSKTVEIFSIENNFHVCDICIFFINMSYCLCAHTLIKTHILCCQLSEEILIFNLNFALMNAC